MDLVKIEEKEKNDFVSSVDKAAEAEIIAQLRKAWPEDNILCEESGLIKGTSDTTWYVDPLDGTTNFLRGIPHFAVSIGCVKNGRHEHAVVYDPVRREEFTASRGRGAALNGRRIRVSDRHEFNGALIGTGIPFRASQQPFISGYMQCVEHFANNSSGIRRAGSAALDLAYVAAGRLDAFWEFGLREWVGEELASRQSERTPQSSQTVDMAVESWLGDTEEVSDPGQRHRLRAVLIEQTPRSVDDQFDVERERRGAVNGGRR